MTGWRLRSVGEYVGELGLDVLTSLRFSVQAMLATGHCQNGSSIADDVHATRRLLIKLSGNV